MWPFTAADRPTNFPRPVKPPEPADTADHYRILHNGHMWRAVYARWEPLVWWQGDSRDPNNGHWDGGYWFGRDIAHLGQLCEGVILYDSESIAQNAIDAHKHHQGPWRECSRTPVEETPDV